MPTIRAVLLAVAWLWVLVSSAAYIVVGATLFAREALSIAYQLKWRSTWLLGYSLKWGSAGFLLAAFAVFHLAYWTRVFGG